MLKTHLQRFNLLKRPTTFAILRRIIAVIGCDGIDWRQLAANFGFNVIYTPITLLRLHPDELSVPMDTLEQTN